MAKRGRPKKNPPLGSIEITPVKTDSAKLLKQYEQEQRLQLQTLYKELAIVKKKIDLALTQLGFMDSAENVAEAAFKAGRAYNSLDEANDELEIILEGIYDVNDFDHWDDL